MIKDKPPNFELIESLSIFEVDQLLIMYDQLSRLGTDMNRDSLRWIYIGLKNKINEIESE